MNALRTLLLIALAGMLAACADDRSELQSWMNNVRATAKPVQQKIPAPKTFEPFRYDRAHEVDPFVRTRLAGMLPEDSGRGSVRRASLQPDDRRARELLEHYPLDAIRMVGHLANGRQSHALLQVDNAVHQVRVGNRAGQNHGLVTRVSETEIRLRELVQDAAGEWVHRETVLTLQEGGK